MILRSVGTFLHAAKSGRWIARVEPAVQVGDILLDEKGRKVGKIIELLGPVTSPYASMASLKEGEGGLKGKSLYLMKPLEKPRR